MSQYTPKERAEIVAFYIENNRSIVKTVRAYRKKYGRNSAPSDNTIRSLVKNFFEYGSVATRQRPIRSRPRRSDEVLEAVRDSVAGQFYAECAKKRCCLCIEWRWSFNRRCVLKLI